MDLFLAKVSQHATSYAIRSCIALTSHYVVHQSSKLLQTVDDGPLRAELALLQRRLARKIEVISPILELLEFRYTRGNSALEAVVNTGRDIRDGIDALTARLEAAASPGLSPAARHAELRAIIADIKDEILVIDDAIPLINIWVSAMGPIQSQGSSYSPSRLLQASMLVNVGDTQYILDPARPMQIGPDFTLSLYMLFRGHASPDGEPYGTEEGQRKPTWQEVIHKARVRLYRVPPETDYATANGAEVSPMAYTYQLQIVEDLDDGRVHTLEDGNVETGSFDGVALAGIRELVPVGRISRTFYADVGRILNINNSDGASGSPVLLLKRDVQTPSPDGHPEPNEHCFIDEADARSTVSDATLSEGSPQDDIDRQLREESQIREESQSLEGLPTTHNAGERAAVQKMASVSTSKQWSFPHNLDPEWIAMEVLDVYDDASSSDEDEDDLNPEDEAVSPASRPQRNQAAQNSVDNNLMTQLQRMSIASSGPSTRPSSRNSHGYPDQPLTGDSPHARHPSSAVSRTLIEQSPFGAIKTSLSLLQMMLRLTSLQEFEQTTHLSVPDHIFNFYLDESDSSSGYQSRAEAARKVGFDPYKDVTDGST